MTDARPNVGSFTSERMTEMTSDTRTTWTLDERLDYVRELVRQFTDPAWGGVDSTTDHLENLCDAFTELDTALTNGSEIPAEWGKPSTLPLDPPPTIEQWSQLPKWARAAITRMSYERARDVTRINELLEQLRQFTIGMQEVSNTRVDPDGLLDSYLPSGTEIRFTLVDSSYVDVWVSAGAVELVGSRDVVVRPVTATEITVVTR